MTGMKRILVIVLLACVLLSVAAGLVWHMHHYVMVDFQFYPKDAQILDLRQEEISHKQYSRLSRQLPNTRILWNVEFQNMLYSSDITELAVSTLSEQDVDHLAFFERLKVLDASQCTAYDQLIRVKKMYPQLQVTYRIPIAGQFYPQDAQLIEISNITENELSLLPYLTQLETVALSGAENMANAAALQKYCHENGLTFCITLGKEHYSEETVQVTAEGITDSQLALVQMLPKLKKLHIVEPAASAQSLLDLRKSKSDLALTWEKNICGLPCNDKTVDVDLSEMTVTSIADVEQGMAYLPEAKSLFLGFCGLDNEEIAAYRERSRENYKVVWVVDLSGKMKVRTDIDNFMPSRDGWGYVRDHEVDNIRYCEDLICIDLGHMGVKDVSFLETLVNLEYLILAHTEVQYVDPIVNCKKLRYLELDWSCIRDVSPLVELTALEDLNLGMTWPDPKPLLQMTWLKNLYLIKGNAAANFAAHLPNTRVVTRGEYTVSSGWRNLPNYYAMRDILGMYYM